MPPHVRRDPRPEVRRGVLSRERANSVMQFAWENRGPILPKRSPFGEYFEGTTAYSWFSKYWSYTFGGNTYPAAPMPGEE